MAKSKEEKIARRKARREKRMAKYVAKIKQARSNGTPRYVPLHVAVGGGPWPDSSSPTGYSQVCDYDKYGTCQFPCNGDC